MRVSHLSSLVAVVTLTARLGLASQAPKANVAAFGWRHQVDLAAPAAKVFLPEISPTKPATLTATRAIQVDWDNPRDVREVRVSFRGPPPSPESLRLEWWRRIWPDNGTGGWMKLDDPFNGNWVVGETLVRSNAQEFSVLFRPLTAREAPGLKQAGADFRRTYKIRLTASQPAVVEDFAVYSDAVSRQTQLRFEWSCRHQPGPDSPSAANPPVFEVRNGRLRGTPAVGSRATVVAVDYADSTNRLSPDRGLVVCRRGPTNSFSVFVDDVLREGGLYVRDSDVFVSAADRNLTFATWGGPSGEVWREGTVVEQVSRAPEQSFENVRRAIPLKPVPYMFLGVPLCRQKFTLGANGDLILRADSLRCPGPDSERRPWNWSELIFQFASGPQPTWWRNNRRVVTRSLEAGWLPVATHSWREGDISYTQTSVAAPLAQPISSFASQDGTEPLVLATRIQLRNESASPRTAWLWLALNYARPLALAPDGLLRLTQPSDGTNRPGLEAVRGCFRTGGQGRLELVETGGPAAVRYQIDLAPGGSHALEFNLPYLELLRPGELAALRQVSFSKLHPEVVGYWRERVGRGMTYEVPDLFLNEFFQASLWHALITTEIDPVTRQYQHGAATHHYKNYLNETMMVARALEMRGEHALARRLIETFLANQSVKGLPGNFATREGVLYAAHPTEPDPYTAQGYNMHHGFGLWGAAEHYFWTRDAAWLVGVADKLVKGCDWVTRERQATRRLNPDGSKPVEYGLAPAGDLEDVEEYLYFYATDAYYHLGLKTVAQALAAVTNGPAAAPALSRLAERLARETTSFRQDIQASLAESVATTPVVRLRDGTYLPFVPPRVHALTHLKEGWIREALYPALHLVFGEVYEERHPFTDWMIQDLEDNVFLSRESGYGPPDPRANFFNLGGFTLQPNLPDLPLTYLKRDQVPNFLRGFYNTAWASLYPETMCFAEWVPAFGKGSGPLYKTPDECKFVQWMGAMLVLERDGGLELGLGVPRAWMRPGQRVRLQRAATWFGSLDLNILSHADTGEIRASVRLRKTDSPRHLRLRLRHPDGRPLRAASVNGRSASLDLARQLIELPPTQEDWEVVGRF